MHLLVRSLAILALPAALVANDAAFAHGGGHQPLFVAENGVDRGRCADPAAPCRTIGYALSVAGKGAEIRVAAGSYEVADPEVLLHMLSRSVNVVGGYAQNDAFAKPGAGTTTLVGVPHQYRARLESRGFDVIADRKSLDSDAARAGEMLAVYDRLKTGLPPAECVNGLAGELACTKVDLLAHVALEDVSAAPAAGNDVWGFVDLNTGREYALAGFDIGTAVFDITDPANPIEVGFVEGQRTTWRDIKVYQHYDAAAGRWRAWAYVTADQATDGLFVLDLGGLPHTVAKAGFASDFFRAHNIYLTNSDYATGLALRDAPPLLIVAGSDLGSGAFRAYSLADPAAPALISAGSAVPGGSATIYTHDSASAVITDARKDMCESGAEYCEVLLDFNEDEIVVWNISDPANPVALHHADYPQASYVHSGWWSENRQYFFVHDELDEQNFGLRTTLRVYSMADLTAPAQIGTWTGPTRAIDHNGFVRGNRYYMANYARGLTILDITNPAAPQDAGFLDLYPFSDNPGFQGAWGAYPFFFSNTVAANDIDSGLYLARDRTLDVAQGRLSFGSASVAGEEGQAARLTVNRTGGAQAAVSVGFEIVHATAGPDDYIRPGAVLSWAAGDTSPRFVDLPLVNDGAAEGLERLLVRLVAPEGGATLGEVNVASVYVADPAAAPAVGLFEPSIEIAERGFGTAVVVLRRSGSATAAASVDYGVIAGSASVGADFDGALNGTVTWPAGDGDPRSIEFAIADDGLAESKETFTFTLSNPSGAAIDGPASAAVTILDASARNAAPNAVAGGDRTVSAGARVTLDGEQSNDPDGDALGFAWQQVAGPGVTLENATGAVAGFTAPSVQSDTLLRFQLTVTDAGGLTDSATVTVTVSAAAESGGSGSLGWWTLALLALTTARARHRKPSP